MTDDKGRMDCPFTGALTDCVLCPEDIKRRCTPDFVNTPAAVVKSESDPTTMIYDRDVKDEESGAVAGKQRDGCREMLPPLARDATGASKPTRCTITCMEHGCQTPIFYQSTDDEVPLYCEKHRTDEGRHSQVRVLKKPEPVKPAVRKVIMICPKCKDRKIITEGEWTTEKEIRCPCGTKMIYHKDAEEKK
jgi:hypothetical protein